jgi:hypothetical protein
MYDHYPLIEFKRKIFSAFRASNQNGKKRIQMNDFYTHLTNLLLGCALLLCALHAKAEKPNLDFSFFVPPTITVVSTTDPSTCGGDGSIEFSFTNVPDNTYTIDYLDGMGIPGQFLGVSVSGGFATVDAPAGEYNQLSITVASETSTEDPNVTLTDPPFPNVSFGMYQYSRGITIPAANVDGAVDLEHFPLLVQVDLDETHVTSPLGYDVIFTDDDNNLLDFELNDYDNSTGLYTAWVRIPLLSGSVDNQIKIWYGNTAITTNQSNALGTWYDQYTGIWHCENDQIDESTLGVNNGTNFGSQDAQGKIGRAREFDGSSYIGLPDSNSIAQNLSSATLSLWLNIEDQNWRR